MSGARGNERICACARMSGHSIRTEPTIRAGGKARVARQLTANDAVENGIDLGTHRVCSPQETSLDLLS